MPVSIIIVTYNSAHVLFRCLGSIPDGPQVIVVDNHSADSSVEVARRLGAQVIVNPENYGFGKACNIGARHAVHDLVLFLNPDASLRPETLGALAAGVRKYPDAGAYSLKITNSEGQHFFRKRSVLYTTWPWARSTIPSEDAPIKNASGAAIAFPKAFFEEIGGFDENIFLYFEDDDISLRVRKAGRVIMYLEHARVDHALGTGSPLNEATLDFKEYHYAKAMRYVCAKHGRPVHLHFRRLKANFQLVKAIFRGNRNKQIALRAKLRAFNEKV